jgi:hypothetical protein
MTDPIIIVVTALLASIPGIITAYIGRKKQQADAVQVIQAAAAGLVVDLKQRIDDLEVELKELRPLRDEVQDLKYRTRCQDVEIGRLQKELTDASGRIQCLETENERLRAGK